jgi:hypothetical protein
VVSRADAESCSSFEFYSKTRKFPDRFSAFLGNLQLPGSSKRLAFATLRLLETFAMQANADPANHKVRAVAYSRPGFLSDYFPGPL